MQNTMKITDVNDHREMRISNILFRVHVADILDIRIYEYSRQGPAFRTVQIRETVFNIRVSY